MTLRPSPPLRTVRASFPAYGSSLRNHSFKRAGKHNGVWSGSTTASEISRVGWVERVRLSAYQDMSPDRDRGGVEDPHRSRRSGRTGGTGEYVALSFVWDEVLPPNPAR